MVRLRELIGHSAFVISLVKLSTNKIASSSFNGDIKIWSLTPGQCLKTITTNNSGDRSFCLDILSKNKIISYSYYMEHSKTVKIWNIEKDECENALDELSLIHVIKYSN